MGKIDSLPIWFCDRCKAERMGKSYPTTESDNWGKLKIDQNAGFDCHGAPWAQRMREPLLLCGGCLEEVIATINKCLGFEVEPGVHSGCDKSGGDCPVCNS